MSACIVCIDLLSAESGSNTGVPETALRFVRSRQMCGFDSFLTSTFLKRWRADLTTSPPEKTSSDWLTGVEAEWPYTSRPECPNVAQKRARTCELWQTSTKRDPDNDRLWKLRHTLVVLLMDVPAVELLPERIGNLRSFPPCESQYIPRTGSGTSGSNPPLSEQQMPGWTCIAL